MIGNFNPLHQGTRRLKQKPVCLVLITASDTGAATASEANVPAPPAGLCKCYALPISLSYWFAAGCGFDSGELKRDLDHRCRSDAINATRPPTPAQLAFSKLPSPCNASYVSYACSDFFDGIVHEPPGNWLSALLPEHETIIPPVLERFLEIQKIKDDGITVGWRMKLMRNLIGKCKQ